jgi:hypothetical protein
MPSSECGEACEQTSALLRGRSLSLFLRISHRAMLPPTSAFLRSCGVGTIPTELLHKGVLTGSYLPTNQLSRFLSAFPLYPLEHLTWQASQSQRRISSRAAHINGGLQRLIGALLPAA